MMHSFQSARDRHGTKLNILLEYPLRHIAAGAHFWLTAILEFSRRHNAAFGRHNATPLVLSVRSSETGWPVSRFNDSMAHELAVIEAGRTTRLFLLRPSAAQRARQGGKPVQRSRDALIRAPSGWLVETEASTFN